MFVTYNNGHTKVMSENKLELKVKKLAFWPRISSLDTGFGEADDISNLTWWNGCSTMSDATVSLLEPETGTKYNHPKLRAGCRHKFSSLTKRLPVIIRLRSSHLQVGVVAKEPLSNSSSLRNGTPISYDLNSEENDGGGGLDHPNSESDCAIIWRKPRQLC